MKILLSFLLILLSPTAHAQLKANDNLKYLFGKIEKPYYFEAPGFTDWVEGTGMVLIGDKPNPNDCQFVFIGLRDTTLIGVFTVKKPNQFWMDSSGNSILGNASDFFMLPQWVVKNKTKIKPADKRVLLLLDKLYETALQADESAPDKETLRLYQQYKTDTTLANRHIILLFDNYQMLVTETSIRGTHLSADLALPTIKSLAGECMALYNKIPPIVCVYMGEALLSAGMEDEARNYFKTFLQYYPKSIPMMVYNYRLEQDPGKKRAMLADLKKNHPEHWMVKDL